MLNHRFCAIGQLGGKIAVGLALLLPLAASARAQTDASAAGSLEARKELMALGITWSPENFRIAVMRRDYPAVELFLKGGIDPHNDMFFKEDFAGGSLLTLFAIPDNFDAKIGDMLMKYPAAIDPIRDCPTSRDLYGRRAEQFSFYVKAAGTPDLARFVRFFCDKPAVLAKIDEHISTLKADLAKPEGHIVMIGAKQQTAAAIRGWTAAKTLLAGSP